MFFLFINYLLTERFFWGGRGDRRIQIRNKKFRLGVWIPSIANAFNIHPPPPFISALAFDEWVWLLDCVLKAFYFLKFYPTRSIFPVTDSDQKRKKKQ